MSASPETRAASADRLAAGRAALARGAWAQARADFEAAVGHAETAEGLEGLSWAAWWTSDAALMFDARERAYARYREAGDARGAARMAMWLGTDHVDFRGEMAVGRGWLGRARRLLEGVPEAAEHGWLRVHEAEKHLHLGELDRARDLAAEAAEAGERLGIVDLQMLGLAHQGLALVAVGEAAAGVALLDEASVAALGSEFAEPWAAGWCACCLISACEQMRDFGRAEEWCRRLSAWSERMDAPFMFGVCRAQYAGVLVSRGSWEEAERELLHSVQTLTELRPPQAVEALVRLADLRRRQGRHAEATEILEGAAGHPLSLLGLGELCMDAGNAAGAQDRAEEYLRETPPQAGTLRAAGLDLLVRAQVALGETDRARATLAELEAVSERVATEPLRATASYADGLVAAAAGEPERARRAFEDATRLFHRSGAPFEAARARVGLARALAASRRGRDASRELKAASASLRRIGADHEAALVDGLELEVRRAVDAGPGTLTPREREVLRLIARGQPDREIAADLVLSEHTVHRHVANILAKLNCSSRTAAVAAALTRELI